MAVVLTLPSNSSKHLYPRNRTSSYKVQFPKRLEFTDGKYEVGLTAFHYPRTWYNLATGGRYRVRFFINEVEDFTAELKKGYYDTESRLCDALTDLCIGNSSTSHVRFSYNPVTEKATIALGHENGPRGVTTMVMSSDLAIKLGWPPRRATLSGMPGESFESPGVMRLHELDAIFINCDLAGDHHVVGDSMVPLLKVVTVDGVHGSSVTFEPKTVDWLPLRKNTFDTAEVMITDSRGNPVPFERGIASVQVHIRRVNPFS